MRWMSEIGYRLRSLFGRSTVETELREEFAFHVEMETRKLRAEGHEPEEARRLALVRFGGEERFKEAARESWGVAPLMDLFGDVRFAARQLRKRPAFSILAATTLALGIGGTVALASVVGGLLLRPLPVADEHELVTFWSDYDWRGAEFDYLRERIDLFDDIAAYTDDATTLQAGSGARLMLYSLTSANLFDVLGVGAELGRTFEPGEDRPGAEPAMVLSYGTWEREFGKDPGILGRRIELGGTMRTVIGVMPRGFFFPSPESEAWIPLNLDPSSGDYQGNGWLVLTGRLGDGATPERTELELARLSTALGEQWDYPAAWDKTRDPYLVPTRDFLLGDVRAPLILLLGAVGLVLLTACANVAALLLTRTSDRAGEMSVRTALGAGRARLARQVLTESVLLGVVSGVLGVGIAVAGFDVLVASLPLPRQLGATLALDWTTLVAGIVLAIGSGCLVSLAPMHGLLRGDLSGAAFGARSSGGTSRGQGRVQRALVVAEVLTAVVLTTGTALLMRTVSELRSVDVGLDASGVMAIEFLLPDDEVSAATRPALYPQLLSEVRAIPGVTQAGLIGRVPVRDGGWQATVTVTDRPDLRGQQSPNSFFRPVSPGALEALDVALLEGRWFTALDGPDQPNVGIVNETFARTMFPDGRVIGRVIERHGSDRGPIEIVGVVADVAVDDLVGEVPMAAYYPWMQTSAESGYGSLAIRTELEPTSLVDPVRRILGRLEPRAALGRTESMEAILAGAMTEPLRLRFFLALFSALGVVLGTVGVYGVVAYMVQRRQAEYGVRMALGARPRDLVSEIVRAGMVPVVLGVVAGSGVAFLGSSVLAGFLFGVSPTDPASLLTASAGLLLVGGLAALLPALRASRTDPAIALRSE